MTRASDTARIIGAGVTDFTVGDDIALNSDSAQITFGADSEVILAHANDTGLTLQGSGLNTNFSLLSFHTTDSTTPDLRLGKSGSNTVGTFTETASGELLGQIRFTGVDSNNSARNGASIVATQDSSSTGSTSPARLGFFTDGTERMRFFGSGNTTFSTTNQSPAEGTGTGARIGTTGKVQLSSTGDTTLILNRVQDGRVQAFHSAGSLEGEIGISGSTTTYGAFTGTHWSRLTDNSQPTILKGTVLENIDEMCDWYQVQFEVDGSTHKANYALKDGEKVGDTITYTYKQDNVDDADYQATIIKEDDDKHTKCKISDAADSNSVYGVFCAWDSDDDNVNDMKVASLGTHVVRVNKNATVSKGDLLVSNGDGTAKVQDDDIIRSKTIGKVLTNIKQETYDDGSYTVPCALYCG